VKRSLVSQRSGLTSYPQNLRFSHAVRPISRCEGGILDYTIKIGGEAGQGVDTVSGIVAKLLAMAGYSVFVHQDYESRVRGGHNFFQIRFADKPISASRDVIDILVAFDRQSIALHAHELSPQGMVIYDGAALKEKHEGEQFLDVPFTDLAVTQGGNKIMANVVAVGALMGMLAMDTGILFDVIRESLQQKGEEVVTSNVNAARAGYDFAGRECVRCSFTLTPFSERKMLIGGNDAIGLGAVLSIQ
jgi:2-oxoglutarate ferredoxin oxidoreductase subunit alpha